MVKLNLASVDEVFIFFTGDASSFTDLVSVFAELPRFLPVFEGILMGGGKRKQSGDLSGVAPLLFNNPICMEMFTF